MQPLTRIVQQRKQQARKTPFIPARLRFGGLLFLSLISTLFVYTYTRTQTPVLAATSSTFNFQARLMTGVGSIVPDGYYNVQFKLYDGGTDGGPAGTGQANAGTNLWTETYYDSNGGTPGNDNRVQVKSGYLTVNLGSQTAFPGTINWDQELWLTMNIGGTTQTATPTWDGEMLSATNTRIKLTAVPYAFKAAQADRLTITGGSITGDSLSQLAPSAIQTINSAVAGLRINQAGAGNLLQLQGDGSDVFTVSKTGAVTTSQGLTIGASSLTTAGTLRWTGADFEGYDGSQWVSLTAGSTGGTGNSSITLTSSVTNMAATATTPAGLLVFTSGTAVSNSAGTTTGFVAPADGSFRSCTVNNNAAITAGTISVRWRVNGASVGAAACAMSAANARYGATTIDPGVVTFSAGDTINIAFESSGLTPAGSTEYTAYWTVEYGGNGVPSNAFVDGGNTFGSTAVLGTSDAYGLTLITNGLARMSIASDGNISMTQSLTIDNGLNVNAGGIDITGSSTIDGTLTGLTGLTVTSGGANVTGGLDLNSGGVTNAGILNGVSAVNASGALDISSGGGGALTLSSASGALVLDASVLRRTAAGTTAMELNDTADTLLSIVNTDASAVAGLSVEGLVSAAEFSGDGGGLSGLDAANISTGTLSDTRLSANVGLLNTAQTYTARQTFSNGLVLGSSIATAGALRWTGTDFEGYDGSAWVSLTGGAGPASGPLSALVIQTFDNAGGTDINTGAPAPMPWNSETKKDAGFTHSNVANNTRVYLDAAGWYKVSYQVSGENQGTTGVNVLCQVRLNGVTYANPDGSYSYSPDSTDRYTTNAASIYIETTAANEYVEIVCSQAGTAGQHLAVAGQSWMIAEMVEAPAAGPTNAFEQGGNAFGGTALLGTTDAEGLTLITNGAAALIIDASGAITAQDSFIIDNGLSVLAGGASVIGGLDLSGDGIANAGALSNVDSLTGAGTLTIASGAAGDLGFDSASGILRIAGDDTALRHISAGEFTLDFSDGANTALKLTNGGGGAAALNLDDGGLQIAGIDVLSNGRQLQNLTGLSSSGTVALGSLSSGGLVKATSGTGDLSVATAGTDYELPLSFANGLTRTGNGIALGGNLNSATNIGLNGNALTFSGSGSSTFTALAGGGIDIKADSTAALVIGSTGSTSFFTVNTSGNLVQVGSSSTDATAILAVLDSYNGVSDPSGVNGASYYSTAVNKARCYENGYWSDCMTTRAQGDVTLAAPANSISVSLPSSVSDLKCYIKSPGLSAAARVNLRFDNVATNYGYNTLQNLTGANNNTTTVSGAAATEIRLMGSGTSANSFSSSVSINNFASAAKAVEWTATSGGTSGIPQRYQGSGVYYNAAAAIGSVQFITSAGNFNTGTRAWCEAR